MEFGTEFLGQGLLKDQDKTKFYLEVGTLTFPLNCNIDICVMKNLKGFYTKDVNAEEQGIFTAKLLGT
ncbi:hypothetical protein DAPPUDRAFT_313187 [Daphnia pulex]|uniref:Uncharacterized protein n=1 Tax=Daphnia pulex TaxID=6669 RepID=E9G344_DAPPU|nr:hypothetical protein DAPPUDRAFT_313187 [Daphnia pulex]|eukprot:EFX86151.1 hypothetical protein DAPPUDRAFT_313187 [Daphnia pulex]